MHLFAALIHSAPINSSYIIYYFVVEIFQLTRLNFVSLILDRYLFLSPVLLILLIGIDSDRELERQNSNETAEIFSHADFFYQINLTISSCRFKSILYLPYSVSNNLCDLISHIR